MTIFVSTAYLDEAERCHRVGLIHRGRLLACGTPGEVKQLMRGTILEIRTDQPRQAVAVLEAATCPRRRWGCSATALHVVSLEPERTAAEAQAALAQAGIDVGRHPRRSSRRWKTCSSRCWRRRRMRESAKQRRQSHLRSRRHLQIMTFRLDGEMAMSDAGRGGRKPGKAVRQLRGRRSRQLPGRAGRGLRLPGAERGGQIDHHPHALRHPRRPAAAAGTVAGFDIRTQPEQIKANIGYMSQKFSLYQDLTVEENIDFYSGIYRIPPRKEAAAEGVGDRDGRAWPSIAASRRPILSGGWKQRLALGCAILHEPPIVFLDEPTSGVDPISRRQFWDLIYELSGQGVTVFVTTHYMDEAEYCDRLGLIYRGELIALGTPHELKAGMMARRPARQRCPRWKTCSSR